MKTKYTIVMFLLMLFLYNYNLQAQVTNGGFESWNGDNVSGWTHNSTSFIPTVIKTLDAYSGSFAVKGLVYDIGGGNGFPPTFFTGTHQSPTISISQNYSEFSGRYKFTGSGGDALFIEVILLNLSMGGGAEGHAEITTNSAGYQEVVIPLTYSSDNPPGWQATEASITITIKPVSGQAPHVGTSFIVDHFTFDNAPVGVKEIDNGLKPTEFSLKQNYPNPFNPNTTIEFSLPVSGEVNLSVYNMLGKKVKTIINKNMSSGNYTADFNSDNLSSGTYIYRITTNGFSQSKKMILLK